MGSPSRLDDQRAGCCSSDAAPVLAPAQRSLCPACAAQSKTVSVATVRALLSTSLRAVTHEAYYFCKTPDCPVVYFTFDGGQQFTSDQLRERVFQKAPAEPAALVCYCFQYTRKTVQQADASTHAQIVADITAGVQAGQCACDIRNPQGSCCLGNVRRLVAAAAYGKVVDGNTCD
jgi:hypothetical protein